MFEKLPKEIAQMQCDSFVEVTKANAIGMFSKQELFGLDPMGEAYVIENLNEITNDEYLHYAVKRTFEGTIEQEIREQVEVSPNQTGTSGNQFLVSFTFNEVITAESRGDAIKQMEALLSDLDPHIYSKKL